MDLSAFSAADFKATDWINNNFHNFSEDDDKGTFIASYISKLQLSVQELNLSIEDTSQQIIANLPRIIKDTKSLHTDVKNLQNRMNGVRSEIQAVQDETGDCMESLEKLNKLQTKLQHARESLKESDGWGNLISDLEDSFEQNDLLVVCDKIVSLQKSLLAQEKLSGHADRVNQVEDFKNRLEALASPSVVQAFSMCDTENAKKHVKIFEDINRLPQLKQYYRAVQKATLQQHWKDVTDLTDSSYNFLLIYCEFLIENCEKQIKWCRHVFGENSGDQPFLILAETLPSLTPSRDAHIMNILKSSTKKLETLEKFAKTNTTFMKQLQSIVRNYSVKLSSSLKVALADTVFSYFQKFIQQYPRIEEGFLLNQVEKAVSQQSNVSDSIRRLEDYNRKLFEWLQKSCDRCEVITANLSLCRLIGIIGGVIKKFFENYTKALRQLNLNVNSDQNWTVLQNCLSLMQCLGDFQVLLSKFEKNLYERMSLLEETITIQDIDMTIFSICDESEINRILLTIKDYQQKQLESSQGNTIFGIFPSVYDLLKTSFIEAHDICLTILLSPIEQQLRNIQPQDNLNSLEVDLPAFSFAPQECITQVGQYLLTLPQHLEPLLLSPSALLRLALETCNVKYAQNIPCADVLLSLVVEQCCVIYQSQILQLKTLNTRAAKQLSVDIEYVSNVVEELGLSITPYLGQIANLLKAPPENYLALSAGCEPRLVTAVRQMRHIISTE